MSEQNELINAICAFGGTGVSVFLYSRANQSAIRLYKLEMDGSIKANEADSWIKRKSNALRLFYGVGAILMTAIGLVSLYRYFS